FHNSPCPYVWKPFERCFCKSRIEARGHVPDCSRRRTQIQRTERKAALRLCLLLRAGRNWLHTSSSQTTYCSKCRHLANHSTPMQRSGRKGHALLPHLPSHVPSTASLAGGNSSLSML